MSLLSIGVAVETPGSIGGQWRTREELALMLLGKGY